MAAENVGGTYSGDDASELSLLLSQEFELGGKRSARTTAAEAASATAGLEADLAILDIYLVAKQRFTTAAHADERLRLARAHESVVAELADAARERVRAGAALLADQLLADVALVRVRQEALLAEMERTRARRDLAALWGEPDGVSKPLAALALPERLPEPDSIAAWVDGSAAVTRARRATAASQAGLQIERSLRVPTLTAGAGLRRVEADDATTFLFSASLPRPLWDRRDGAIQSAQAQVRAGELETELARSVTRSHLEAGLGRLSAMRERLRQSNESTLPTLQSAAREMETAYRIGRASYADLLEVHRMRIEVENEINDLHLAIVHEVSEIERLTARTIEEMMSDE
jgi:cobalt-zinc-cadmium efflux system outer membrane protein